MRGAVMTVADELSRRLKLWEQISAGDAANAEPSALRSVRVYGGAQGIWVDKVGLCLIGASLWFNVWSRKQKAIDGLAEDMSFAIHDLVNRKPRPQTDDDIKQWKKDYEAWCDKVSKKLENRAFFTRADQLHFDDLGFIDPLFMTGLPKLDELLGQLRLKFERLRDVINWTQQRRR
jgi:hypothetical protein